MQDINKSAELEELILSFFFVSLSWDWKDCFISTFKRSKIREILSSIFASAAVRACLFKIFAKPLFVSQNERIRETIRPGTSSEG